MVSVQEFKNWKKEQDQPEETDKMQEIESYLSNLGYNTKGLTAKELKDMFYRENEGESYYGG